MWARRLEQAGAHVVYGLVGLKTHSKVALVVRREGIGLRRYVHIGTGNYNSKTARSYVDIGLLSCREELGADATDLFNSLTGLSRQRVFRRLIVAPTALRSRFLELVEREATTPAPARPPASSSRSTRSSTRRWSRRCTRRPAAGVEIDCIIRGACCLVPGVEGLSEHIRVRSVDRRVPRALADLDVRQRRARRVVHRLRRPHGAQPRPARRGRDARRGPGGHRPGWRGSSRCCWPTTGARGSSGRTATGVRTEILESVEGTIDTFAVLKEDAAPRSSSPIMRVTRASGRRIDGSTRVTAIAGGEADRGRAQVPDDRRGGR